MGRIPRFSTVNGVEKGLLGSIGGSQETATRADKLYRVIASPRIVAMKAKNFQLDLIQRKYLEVDLTGFLGLLRFTCLCLFFFLFPLCFIYLILLTSSFVTCRKNAERKTLEN